MPRGPTESPASRRPAAAALGLCLAAAVLAPSGPAASGDPPPAPAAAPAPPATPGRAELAALDRVLARFAALVARDDDARHQAAARAVLAGLQARGAAVQAAFDQAKYDDLRAELNLALQRQAAWLARRPASP